MTVDKSHDCNYDDVVTVGSMLHTQKRATCCWPGCERPTRDLAICSIHASIVHDHVVKAGRRSSFERRKPSPPADAAGIVYYLQVGALIKIGFSTNLPRRLAKYPPDSVLLATEPGSRALERQRHLQFAEALSLGREWFTEDDTLREHVASLRSAA